MCTDEDLTANLNVDTNVYEVTDTEEEILLLEIDKLFLDMRKNK